jgi:hypothetical protein
LTNTKGVMHFEAKEQVAVELQHIKVKLLVKDSASVDWAAVVPLFHGWIQGQIFEELLLDVADYSHVPDGPGIMLIGHEADYALDNTDGRLGVSYKRKAPLPGSNRDRLEQGVRASMKAFERLAQDLKLDFNGRDVEIVINDRLLAPNTAETRNAVEPELKSLFTGLFAEADYSLAYQSEPRRLFGVTASATREFSLDELLQNLDAARNDR